MFAFDRRIQCKDTNICAKTPAITKRNGTRSNRSKSNNGSQPIYKFHRFAAFNSIQAKALTTTYGATYFSLDQVPGYTEFTALFDQYRITRVIAHFWPTALSVTNTNSSSTIVNVPPRIVHAIDYDDSVAPTSVNEVREYSTARTNYSTEKFTRDFKPAVSRVVYEGVSSSGYSPDWDVWVSTNDPTVPHYGLKWALGSVGTSGADNAFGYVMEVEFFMEFKQPK